MASVHRRTTRRSSGRAKRAPEPTPADSSRRSPQPRALEKRVDRLERGRTRRLAAQGTVWRRRDRTEPGRSGKDRMEVVDCHRSLRDPHRLGDRRGEPQRLDPVAANAGRRRRPGEGCNNPLTGLDQHFDAHQAGQILAPRHQLAVLQARRPCRTRSCGGGGADRTDDGRGAVK